VYGGIIETRFDYRPAIIDGDIARIPLGINGKDGHAIVDRECAMLDRIRWYKTSTGYVATNNNLTMHQFVMNFPEGLEIDHINHDPLDNRICNLRPCTSAQNKWNLRIRKSNTTGYKGVTYDKNRQKYVARLSNIHLGRYDTSLQAAEAYNRKALELHGQFALLNVIPPHETP